jgi:hypothetical protein
MAGIRILAGAGDFSLSHSTQTGSGAQLAFYPMGTGGPFHRGVKKLKCEADHSPPSNAKVMNGGAILSLLDISL